MRQCCVHVESPAIVHLRSDWPGRDADNSCPVGDIVRHHRAGAHNAASADGSPRQDVGADADLGAFADCDIAGRRDPRTNMHVVADDVVMTQTTGAVQDDIGADLCGNANHCGGADVTARSHCHVAGQHGRGMANRRELEAGRSHRRENLAPYAIVADSNYRAVMLDSWRQGSWSKNRDPLITRAMTYWIVIEKAHYNDVLSRIAQLEEDISDGLGMGAAAENQDAH